MSIKSNKQLVGWQVFWDVDLYDTGRPESKAMLHESRAKARHQMRLMKAQPWTFSKVWMARVSFNGTHFFYERAR